VLLALLVGVAIYFSEAKKQQKLGENGFLIAFGAVAGGIVGAKVLQWALNYKFVLANFSNLSALLSGRTIVGGLLGGVLGSLLTKKILGVKEKRGNLFAPAVAAGMAIGRLGCFFQGCCFGKATGLLWGVDFGDHILRHPTQLYEALFMTGMFIFLEKIKDRADIKPGELFKILMVGYFVFRFLIEFIRVEPVVLWGFTSFQIISIGVIIYSVRDNLRTLIYNLKIYARR